MNIKHLCIVLLSVVGLFACEKEFSPNLPTTTDDIVVEGFIESVPQGRQGTPPYILLTKAIPFFKEIKSFNGLYINGAEVWVSDGKDSVRLQEFCWKDLDTTRKKLAAQSFGIDLDSVNANFNFCAYIDLAQRLKPAIGKTYFLRIKTQEGLVLTAQTTIPRLVPIDTAEFIKPPGTNKNDSMAQMRPTIRDPKGADFYRYFTAVNGSSYVVSRNSVVDDAFFDGQKTTFNLLNTQPRPKGDAPENFGLFRRGDTVSIKYCTIDKAHFDFWNSLEFNSNNGGPFASYTKVKHNIVGGLGIWGSYAVAYYDTVVPKK
jgi:Domain of unknown function (DUF4249)